MGYDVVIVGSGVGGLSAGCVLARRGLRVVVLEQAHVPGGLMQVYRRGGMTFPTGVHYLGALSPGQALWRYLKYLGVLGHLALHPMDAEGYEEYRFGEDVFRLPQTYPAARAALLAGFPGEREAIERYLGDMQKTVAQFHFYSFSGQAATWPSWLGGTSLGAYLEQLGVSPRLRAVLTAPNPLYSVEPGDCPLYVHFLTVDSFLSGAWQIDESSTPLAEAFIKVFASHGGELRCDARVTAILPGPSGIAGVRLADGEVIATTRVVFTGHPQLVLPLCPPGALRPGYCERIVSAPATLAALGVSAAWDAPDCPLAGRSVFVYRDYDTSAQYGQRPFRDGEAPRMVYCSAAVRGKNPAWPVTLLCATGADEWSAWEDTRVGARPEAYRAAKRRAADALVAVVERQWPESRGVLRVVDTFTPLTMRDYTLAPGGTAYGIKKTVSAGMGNLLNPRTRLPGLFLAGQSLMLPGVVGTLISSMHAAMAVLGDENLLSEILQETSCVASS